MPEREGGLRVVIVGAGGHGVVVADALLSMGCLCPVGFVDDDAARRGEVVLGLPIVGTIADLARVAHDGVVVAIGDNRTRQRIFERLEGRGERFVSVRHPSVEVGRDVALGAGSMLMAGGIINAASRVGRDVIVNTGSTVDHHAVLGDHVHLGPGVHLGGQVTVGEGTLIGIGAVVLPGRRIGAWSVVGAQALVARDVEDGATVVGVPGRGTRGRTRSR